MSEAIDHLLSHPELGPSRDDISPGLRNLRIGQHVMFYRVLSSTVRITRIFLVKMNPEMHPLESPDGE